jgi:hypothetical protein
MNIDRIYIACFKHDARFTRILVSSIRFRYSDVPISIIKDETYGPFDTTDLERRFAVTVFPSVTKKFGWGFGKLEPLFLPDKQRCLILDSDILMAGSVLDKLSEHNEDYIVVQEDPPDDNFVERLYFDLEKLKQFDPYFQYSGYTFNTGQIVATTGILKRQDFDALVDWGSPPQLKQPEIFRCGEQGVLNYVLMKKHAAGEISLKRLHFMEVANNPACELIKLEDVTEGNGLPYVIHWCGLKRDAVSPTLSDMHRRDLLLQFEDMYYQQFFLGPARHKLALQAGVVDHKLRQIVKAMLGRSR